MSEQQPPPQPQPQQYPASSMYTTEESSTVTRPRGSGCYGRPQSVALLQGQSHSFPAVGSVLGPYLYLGEIGKGTFSSIHKCIPVIASPKSSSSSSAGTTTTTAAAKVELSTFRQSGVLEAEAALLEFLDSSLPAGSVPKYLGHFHHEAAGALCMEYLSGADLNRLREEGRRRLHLEDAVLLTADVLLPLLQRMHSVGIVHRDVKPSNCVMKKESCPSMDVKVEDFCMVDFGLSKSIVAAESSELADTTLPWPEGQTWFKPTIEYEGRAFYRKERTNAEFRGTSMYASLRVHQGRDFSPRDDVWGLLYVFCDLATGGLPWMSYAATKDRAACQRLKEWVHDEEKQRGDKEYTPLERMRLLLKGEQYHISHYRRDREKMSKVPPELLTVVPDPLDMSQDDAKVQLLLDAFGHLAKLNFSDVPDYALIQRCIRDFLQTNPSTDPIVERIAWTTDDSGRASPDHQAALGIPTFRFPELFDSKREALISKIEQEMTPPKPTADSWGNLPLRLQLYCAQLNAHLQQSSSSVGDPDRMALALQDWMSMTLYLLHREWDAKRCEEGGHRTSTDGFRRTRYLELLRQCNDFAQSFGWFSHRECYYYYHAEDGSAAAITNGDGESKPPKRPRRTMETTMTASYTTDMDMCFVSQTLEELRSVIRTETEKKTLPPRIAFG